MAEKRKQSAKTEITSVPMEERKLIASAIVEGLINPIGLRFERLASEGGDYDQGQGDYNQSGGGDHDQSGGGYTQSAIVRDNYLDIAQLGTILGALDQLQGAERPGGQQ